jgi:hypothetical protein
MLEHLFRSAVPFRPPVVFITDVKMEPHIVVVSLRQGASVEALTPNQSANCTHSFEEHSGTTIAEPNELGLQSDR